MPNMPTTSEPVRRILFPTPQRDESETPTRSLQRIRPKAELTPIQVDSTPSFRRLVDSSPVPLAVAAAAAAMRAAKSSPNGHPIITDMTRAAEDVINNSDYNSIRPPQPSPRSLSSPRFSTFCPAQSASVSLPPEPTQARAPAMQINALRHNFAQIAVPSFSPTPPVNGMVHNPVGQNDMNRRNALLPAAQRMSHIARRRVATTLFHHPNAISSGANKMEPKQVVPFGNHPTPRPRSKFLSLLRPASAVRVDNGETAVQTRGCLENANRNPETAAKMTESSEDRNETRSQELSEHTAETTPENKENITSTRQTRSLKRFKPEPNPTAEDSRSRKRKKKRRMSEVLRLQKALESAAWTNSLAVERQTEVIEIPDSFSYRPRAEASIKVERKPSRPDGVVRGAVQAEDAGQVAKSDKKSKPRKTIRGTRGPSQQKPAERTTAALIANNKHEKRKVMGPKRKRSSMKNARSTTTRYGNEKASNGSHGTVPETSQTKKAIEKKKKSFDRPRKSGSPKEGLAIKNNPVEITNGIPSPISTASLAKSPAPLKKRITTEQRELGSVLKRKTSAVPHSRIDARPNRSSRKIAKPKRLEPPT